MNTDAHEFTDLLCWDQDPKYPRDFTLWGTGPLESSCSLDIVTRESKFTQSVQTYHTLDTDHNQKKKKKTIQKTPKLGIDVKQTHRLHGNQLAKTTPT